MLKLNLGCASKLLDGYINIDQDNIDVMRQRYKSADFSEDAHIYTYDIFALCVPIYEWLISHIFFVLINNP